MKKVKSKVVETRADYAVAFVFVNGKAHQVVIKAGELLGLLSSWFGVQNKPLQVAEEPIEGLLLPDDFSDKE